MAAIVVLIRHDHDRAVSQLVETISRVHFVHREADYLDNVLDFGILSYLLRRGLSHIQKFTLEWEAAVIVATYDLDARECQ